MKYVCFFFFKWQGIEDYLGDMDFKMAGTRTGVTALQADIKLAGVPVQVVTDALRRATDAKSEILDIMERTISKARNDKKDIWPVSHKLNMDAHKRSKFIGVGGANLKRITAETGVQVSGHSVHFFNFNFNFNLAPLLRIDWIGRLVMAVLD